MFVAAYSLDNLSVRPVERPVWAMNRTRILQSDVVKIGHPGDSNRDKYNSAANSAVRPTPLPEA